MINSRILFSIIMPVYNAEKYLCQTIESILNQTYKNFELIIVNDGSTDDSYFICKKYIKDKRIKLFNQKNLGVAVARNFGIKKSTGDYLMFIDSDDIYLSNLVLEKINNKIIKSDCDLIIFNSLKIVNGLKDKKRFNYYLKNTNINIKEYIIQTNIFKACPWDKVIKSIILKDNEIYFPEEIYSEDLSWSGKLLEKCENVEVIDEVFYGYRQIDNSRSRKLTETHFQDIIHQIKMNTIDNSKNFLINSYYSYEYCVLLGIFNGKNKNIQNEIISLKWLLKYKLCKKVKLVFYFEKIFGIKFTMFILRKFIQRKTNY